MLVCCIGGCIGGGMGYLDIYSIYSMNEWMDGWMDN